MSQELAVKFAEILRRKVEEGFAEMQREAEQLKPKTSSSEIRPLEIGGGIPPLPPRKTDPKPMLEAVNWLIKGGKPAPPDATFAFAFASDKDGNRNEYAELADYLKKNGLVKVSGYSFTLSKDGKFLQRIKEASS